MDSEAWILVSILRAEAKQKCKITPKGEYTVEKLVFYSLRCVLFRVQIQREEISLKTELSWEAPEFHRDSKYSEETILFIHTRTYVFNIYLETTESGPDC